MRLSVGTAVVVSTVLLVGPGLGLVRPQGTRESGPNPHVVTAATFHGLGDLPGGSFFSEAHAVSADGSVVVGSSAAASSTEAFRWTRAQGMVGIGFPEGTVASAATDVSADGSVIVGTGWYGGCWGCPSPIAFRWTADSGFVNVGSTGRAVSVSADGSVIVGGAGASPSQAFRWTPDEGMVDLGDPLLDSMAAAVSADGSIVVGWVETGPSPCDCAGSGCGGMHDGFRWTRSGCMIGDDFPPNSAIAFGRFRQSRYLMTLT